MGREFASFQREQARVRGDKEYFTGEPCKSGHLSPRRVSNGGCVECERGGGGEKESPRQIAVREGARTYRTGKMCKNGHDSERYTVSGDCKACKDEANFVKWAEKDRKRYERLTALCLKYVNNLEGLKGVAEDRKAVEWVAVGGKRIKENLPLRAYQYLCSLPEGMRAKYEHRHLLTPEERGALVNDRVAAVQKVTEVFKAKLDLQELLGRRVKLSWQDSLVMHSGEGEFVPENILLTPVDILSGGG